jgi:hypothetical protein
MMVAMSDDALPRLAQATERIADALERLVRSSVSREPLPRLRVARSPTDTSPSAPVTLKADGMLFAFVQNVGGADTTLTEPTARIGRLTEKGGVIDKSGQPQPSALVPAAKDGPGVILQFQLERSAQGLFRDEPLTLLLPHSPGRYPGVTVLEVTMEPAGTGGGTAQWRSVSTRELPEAHATL